MAIEQEMREGDAPVQARAAVTLRHRIDRQLNPRQGLTAAARFLVILILAATAMAIVETEPAWSGGRERLFEKAELVFAVIFSVEYALRLWSAPESGQSRIRFVLSPAAIVDLMAILGSLLPAVGGNSLLLRLVRVFRLARVAKLGRFSRAMAVVEGAIRSRASHLAVGLVLFLFFMLIGATLIYVVEGDHQPDKFGSIPRALWWTAVTMTTVGYGDSVPITAFGKLLGALISIGGIMLIAIPTGIMAAAFSDQLVQEEAARSAAAGGNGDAGE